MITFQRRFPLPYSEQMIAARIKRVLVWAAVNLLWVRASHIFLYTWGAQRTPSAACADYDYKGGGGGVSRLVKMHLPARGE
jgi:hypothetical protein